MIWTFSRAIWRCYAYACPRWSFSRALWDGSTPICPLWKFCKLSVSDADVGVRSVDGCFPVVKERSRSRTKQKKKSMKQLTLARWKLKLRIFAYVHASIRLLLNEAWPCRWLISTGYFSWTIITSRCWLLVVFIWNVWPWISALASRGRVSRVYCNDVENSSVFSFKTPVGSSTNDSFASLPRFLPSPFDIPTDRYWRCWDDQCWMGDFGYQWAWSVLDRIKRDLPSESVCSNAQTELSRCS